METYKWGLWKKCKTKGENENKPHKMVSEIEITEKVTLQRQEQVRRKILTTGEFWTASCERKFTINKNRGKKKTFSNMYDRFGVNNFNI